MAEIERDRSLSQESIIRTVNLKTWFSTGKRSLFGSPSILKAVDGVDLELKPRTCLGIVGESGSGKTTTARTILKLQTPSDGKVYLKGKDIFSMRGSEESEIRKNVQMIFQDPKGSLNPRMTIEEIVSEPLSIHYSLSKRKRHEKCVELMEQVGLSGNHLERYPHEFSGGQRQRIGIARALSPSPECIICDEPVSALDVSIQAQILELLINLRKEHSLSYIFIAHDISVVKYISDRIAVMYLGKIVEEGKGSEICSNPLHPYTKALIKSVPRITREKRAKTGAVSGDIPDPTNPPPGCAFHPRCPYAKEICRKEIPEIRPVKGDHRVRCYLYE